MGADDVPRDAQAQARRLTVPEIGGPRFVIAPSGAASQARHTPGENEAVQTPCQSAFCNSAATLKCRLQRVSAALWQDYVFDIVDFIYGK